MQDPIARITMGHLVFVIYWTDDMRQADVMDTHAGARNRDQFEKIYTIEATGHIFDLIQAIIDMENYLI